jgi:peptidoglycan/LPS O-acetylase OafA/YrhL
LDGLRGLAVLGVLLFHSNAALVGGYLGVDLFFVLSGFLITSLLLVEHAATGKIVLKEFWVRRARRLFPALLGLFPALALYAWWIATPDELAGLRGDALATLGYVANWRSVLIQKDYWDLFVAPSPLEHTWSLAIEEQFYLVWPLLFVGIARFANLRRNLALVSLALALISHGLMFVLFDADRVSRVYLGTDTRVGAILLGAALAALLRPGVTSRVRTARALDALGAVALVGLGAAWLKLEGQNALLYRGGFLAAELGCLVLITCAALGERSYCARLLSVAPLRWMGAVSYGVYLWHWPVFCVLTPERLGLSWNEVHALRWGVTLGVAALSYVYFEQPIRKRGVPGGHPWLTLSGAVAACLAVMWVSTQPVKALPVPAGAAVQPGALTLALTKLGVLDVPFTSLPPPVDLPADTPRILVLGDSVAGKLGVAMRFRQEEFHVFVAERSVGNCSILEAPGSAGFTPGAPQARVCSRAWVADVAELKPDVSLIVLGGGFFSRALVDNRWETPCSTAFDDRYAARLDELGDAIEADAGKLLVVLAPYPVGRWRSPGLLAKVDCYNSILKRVAERHHWPTIDLMQHVCPTEECRLLSDGAAIRPDGLHFDGVGAEGSARFTLAEILRLAALRPVDGAP